MPVINLGSLNVDRVVRVPHVARAGETIAGTSFQQFPGGKGANQSVALARAGAEVVHVGRVGADGAWLVDRLRAEGIDIRRIRVGTTPTGQAMIQVDPQGENAIVLFGGANREIESADVEDALDHAAAGSWLLVQNETNGVAHAIRAARARGLRVAFNPAPCDEHVREVGWQQANLLCVNETEGEMLSGHGTARKIIDVLAAQAPQSEIVLTLGAAGAVYRSPQGDPISIPARGVEAVDTTAAGDTFLGYFLALRSQDRDARECLEIATRAAAICISRAGAMDSIPRLDEVMATD
jgi:ribokinase